jgi:hypothetical protein
MSQDNIEMARDNIEFLHAGIEFKHIELRGRNKIPLSIFTGDAILGP